MINLQTVLASRLKPAPYNPRVPLKPGSDEYRRLERSMKEFDVVQPIVWNEATGHVVAGHQRLEILKQWGRTEVDVVVVNLTPQREKALNITLNNQQVGSDWDPDKLIELLAELNDLPDFDASLTGFDADDINDLLLSPALSNVDSPEEFPADNLVRVVIEIPDEQWEDVRPELDELIARENLTVHITTPSE